MSTALVSSEDLFLWLVDGCLLMSSHDLPSIRVCLWPHLFFQPYWTRAHTYDLILPELPLWRLYLQVQSHSEVLRVRTSTYEWGGGTVQLIQGVLLSSWEADYKDEGTEAGCQQIQLSLASGFGINPDLPQRILWSPGSIAQVTTHIISLFLWLWSSFDSNSS